MQYSYEIPLMISVTPLMISKIIAINIVKLFFPLSDATLAEAFRPRGEYRA
jgi:hypothetical protein